MPSSSTGNISSEISFESFIVFFPPITDASKKNVTLFCFFGFWIKISILRPYSVRKIKLNNFQVNVIAPWISEYFTSYSNSESALHHILLSQVWESRSTSLA